MFASMAFSHRARSSPSPRLRLAVPKHVSARPVRSLHLHREPVVLLLGGLLSVSRRLGRRLLLIVLGHRARE
jgi:hypothetical protein